MSPWFALLLRQTPEAGPVGWDEIITGQDFGILSAEEILAWVRSRPSSGEAHDRLAALEGEGVLRLEEHLWAACTEATGRTPRPGNRRWERAQDRWRVAMLRDALDAPLTGEVLAQAVEAIYEHVGCPEDMLGLWTRNPQRRGVMEARIDAILAFLQRHTAQLALAG